MQLYKLSLLGICLCIGRLSSAQYISNYDSLVYKNGVPYEGSKKDDDKLVHYKNGKLHGVQVQYNWKGWQVTKTYYSNGIPDSTIFMGGIVDGKRNVKGVYQNGQPFNGYFLEAVDERTREMVQQVDWYTNGVLEKSFSGSILSELFNAFKAKTELKEKVFYDFNETSSYKDGKLQTGFNYIQDRGIMYQQHIANAKTDFINIAAFDINAVALFSVLPKDDGYDLIEYTVSQEDNQMKIDTQAMQVVYGTADRKKGNVIYTFNNKKMASYDFEFHTISDKATALQAKSAREYFVQNDTVVVCERSNYFMIKDSSIERFKPMQFPVLYMPDFDDINVVRTLLDNGRNNGEEEDALNKYRRRSLGYLLLDNNGKLWGTEIKKEAKANTYSYTIYYDEPSEMKHADHLTLPQLIAALKKEK